MLSTEVVWEIPLTTSVAPTEAAKNREIVTANRSTSALLEGPNWASRTVFARPNSDDRTPICFPAVLRKRSICDRGVETKPADRDATAERARSAIRTPWNDAAHARRSLPVPLHESCYRPKCAIGAVALLGIPLLQPSCVDCETRYPSSSADIKFFSNLRAVGTDGTDREVELSCYLLLR